jgi:hypothetical protein
MNRYIVLILLFVLGPITGVTGEMDYSCGKLTRSECINSPNCTLILNKYQREKQNTLYVCRESNNSCEVNFSQGIDGIEKCESRNGCFYSYGCYCPCKGYGSTKIVDKNEENCVCDCGFGEPEGCYKKPNTALHSDSLPLAGER